MTNYLCVDFREQSLSQIIDGLDKAIKELAELNKNIEWYDGLWFLEDSEPIYGLAFIAFQNYINGSIKDLLDTSQKKEIYYRIDIKDNSKEKSKIELIIGLANYIKHKEDDGDFHKGTKTTLESFNLNTNKEIDITQSAIFGGLDILSKEWNLFEIMDLILTWRKDLLNHH